MTIFNSTRSGCFLEQILELTSCLGLFSLFQWFCFVFSIVGTLLLLELKSGDRNSSFEVARVRDDRMLAFFSDF